MPALARLLKIDLNTLFSFNEDLTELEISIFTNEIISIIEEKGYNAGFQTAMEKIQEYPTCDLLIFTVSLTLEGAMLMFPVENKEPYKEKLEKFYERIANSENQKIHNQAISILISKYMERGEFEKAEKLMDSLPIASFDKTQQQANLYIKQERFTEAAKLLERKLLNMATEIQAIFMRLMEMAIKENSLSYAQYYADMSEKIVKIFDLVDFSAYTAHFQLAVMRKDVNECIAILKPMLTAMEMKWDTKKSRLYRHIETSGDGTLSTRLLPTIIEALQTDKEFEFLRNYLEFNQLIERYKNS